MKHKHCDLIVAWANGAIIEHYRPHFGWEECSYNNPCWSPETNYRIKPKTIKYRNFLWKPYDHVVLSSCTYAEDQREPRRNWQGFIRWIGDWQEVEV